MEMFVLDDEVARLELVLIHLTGAARMDILVQLAWHLRQRDSPRSLTIADQAATLQSQFLFSRTKRQRVRARLQLVRGEAKLQRADLAAATALANEALRTFTTIADVEGCADAYWLLGFIAADRDDEPQRDAALSDMAAISDHRVDSLRVAMANIALTRFGIARDLSAARYRWSNHAEAGASAEHMAVRVWTADCKATVAAACGDFGNAIAHAMRAHEAALSTGQQRRAIHIASDIGASFSRLNDHSAALEWHQRALDSARPTDWTITIGSCLAHTAESLRALNMLEMAEALLQESIALLTPHAHCSSYLAALAGMGNVKLDRHDYKAALDIFGQLEELSLALDQVEFRLGAADKKAHALSCLDRPAEAIAVATQALENSSGKKDERVRLLHELGDIYSRHMMPTHEMGSSANPALNCLLQALEVATAIDGYSVPDGLYSSVAAEYAAVGDYAQAYHYALRSRVARDNAHDHEISNRAIAIDVRHQSDMARADAEHRRQLAIAEAERVIVMQQTSEALERLSAIGREITSSLDVSAMFHAVERHIHGLFDATSLALYVLEPEGLNLTMAFGVEDGKSLPPIRIAVASSTHTARCVRERRLILLDQSPHASNPNRVPDTMTVSSALFAPLMMGERVLGVMTVQSSKPYAYGEREQLIFKTLCAYGAIALDNANAYRQLEAALQTLGHTQAELLDRNVELAHANRIQEEHQSELTRFLAVASHDLRQPMHALNLYLGALIHLELPEPARPILANIRQCAQIMDGMFLALLDLSRLDAKVVQPHVEAFAIQALLSRIAVEFAPAAKVKGLALRVAECSAWVRSDAMLVEQMLRNLTANAIRYTESGSILIGCRRRGSSLRLAVYDTGIGISPDQQKFVFEEFCQVESDTQKRSKGMGLGLAIVRRLGSLLETPIMLESALGRGAMFAIDLPSADVHSAAVLPMPMAVAPLGMLADKMIVVVDDDETIVDAMRVLLEQWQCIVVTAGSGSEAVAKLSMKLQLPDALVCDYRLHNQETGLDVIRLLHDEFNHDIPALLITGETTPDEIQKIRTSASPVLHKPIQAGALRSALIDLLQRKTQVQAVTVPVESTIWNEPSAVSI